MKLLHKLFFETKMSWKRVILFAIATAVVTAVLLLIPAAEDTSFSTIGVSFEWWIFFALIIIMNCETPLEAGAKTFVFFLISQPLIYLLQVPFSFMGWELFTYYPRWGFITLLCFPGGMLAWLVKKDRLFSALILSVATGLLAAESVMFLSYCLHRFPYYLLATLFTAALAVVLILVLLKKRTNRIVAGILTLLTTAVAIYTTFLAALGITPASYTLDEGHQWEISSLLTGLGTVRMDPEHPHVILAEPNQFGTATVTVTNELGEELTFQITCDRSGTQILPQN